MTDRASRALEAVERDPAARARFTAAYGRPGDPVALLRREVQPDATADADRDAEVERLRRVAFDRTNTAEEEAAAELARRELAALEQETRASRAALDRAIDAALEPGAHPPVVGDPEGVERTDDEKPEQSLRPAWLIPAAVALVVGIAATSAVWAWQGPDQMPAAVSASRSPSPIEYFLGDRPDGIPEPGDLSAAEVWFEREQTDEDLVGVGELRPEFDRGSVRLVHSSPIARVWVAKQVDGKLCLETTDTLSQVTNGTCAVAGDFEQNGLSVASNVLTADWNGPQVRVVLSQR
jgi:hypothetical protein